MRGCALHDEVMRLKCTLYFILHVEVMRLKGAMEPATQQLGMLPFDTGRLIVSFGVAPARSGPDWGFTKPTDGITVLNYVATWTDVIGGGD